MSRFFAILFAAMLLTLGLSSTAEAQATRTWISGVGDDVNPCSRTAPCKTFPGAISKTAAGGEIDVLDPGGFGGVTITKAITLDGGGGIVASILVQGSPGITVNAGVNDVVTIRNIDINCIGQVSGSPLANGINFIAGSGLIVERSTIFGCNTNGINFSPSAAGVTDQLSIMDSTISNSGPLGTGTGVLVVPGSATTKINVAISHLNVIDNKNGAKFDSTSGAPINAQIGYSTLSNNTALGVTAVGTGPNNVLIDHSIIANNPTAGVTANGTGVVLGVANNEVTGNGVGLRQLGGTLDTFQNNLLLGNTTPTSGTITNVSPQ